jgi:hypothetical protein
MGLLPLTLSDRLSHRALRFNDAAKVNRLMIAVYLVHCGEYEQAQDALKKFAVERTHDNGKGVTIPSQMRWVHYYQQVKSRGLLTESLTLRTFVLLRSQVSI